MLRARLCGEVCHFSSPNRERVVTGSLRGMILGAAGVGHQRCPRYILIVDILIVHDERSEQKKTSVKAT